MNCYFLMNLIWPHQPSFNCTQSTGAHAVWRLFGRLFYESRYKYIQNIFCKLSFRTTSSCLKLPQASQDTQDIPGHPRTSQDTPGHPRSPQEPSGILRTPQVAIRLNSGCTQVVLRLCLGHHQTLRLLQFILGFWVIPGSLRSPRLLRFPRSF